MNPTKDQTTGVLERLAYGLILGVMMKLVALGWIEADSAPYAAAGIVAAVGGIWAWWINRPKGIAMSAAAIPQSALRDDPTIAHTMAQTAAAIPGTTVVTTAAIAAATPAQTNIVSSVDKKVVSK